MEAEFEEMLNICLTNAPSEFLRLINFALQLRPRTVATLVLRHSRNCSIEALTPLLHLVDNVVRRGGPPFQKVFESDLAELFEKAWKGSSRTVRGQLLKLYLGWRSVFPASLLTAIDHRMKANKTTKRETREVVNTPAMKRMKVEDVVVSQMEPMSPVLEEMLTPIPMRKIHIEELDDEHHDPNRLDLDSEDEDSEEEQESGPKLQVPLLASLLMKAAETSIKDGHQMELGGNISQGDGLLTAGMLKVKNLSLVGEISKDGVDGGVLSCCAGRVEQRKQGIKAKNCRSRVWYATSEAWAHECNPTDLSPTQLLQRLTKPRQWKTTPMSVGVDEEDPQLFCGISGDRLDMQFDEETGKWNYLNCRKLSNEEALANHVPNGTICLNDCISTELLHLPK